MSCCESRQPQPTRWIAAALPSTPVPPPPAEAIPLRYLDSTERALRGPASGRIYRVGKGRIRIEADAADAAAFLRTGLFRE